MKRLFPIIIFAAAALGSGSCKHSLPAENSSPVITVSIEPQRWLLEQIVGDRFEVQCLMSRGGNPESYEPAFSHLSDLERSKCYMRMGNLGFENAIVERISANMPELPIINTSESIELIVDDHGHDHGVDPHVWSSVRNAKTIAGNMLRAVNELDSENKEAYTANYARLLERLDSIDSVCATLLSGADVGRSFVVWHPSLSYFARDYGLRQISVGIEGKEMSVGDTREIIGKINSDSAKVFLVQKDYDTSKAGVISEGITSMRVETINPLNYEWDAEIVQTARAIAGK